MRILTLTSLFPNALMPRHGIFVLERLRQLRARHGFDVTVIAPVPWFPSRHPRWGRYATYAAVPRTERIAGITVHHPRFAAVPRLGNLTNPLAFAAAAMRCLNQLDDGRFDLVDAHYAFPDGIGAARVARRLGIPVVLTVRGSDINVLPHELAAGWWLRRELARFDAVVAVSQALADGVTALEPALTPRLCVLRNGVDLERFKLAGTRAAHKYKLSWAYPTVLSVGNLVPLKGHELVIQALREAGEVSLVIVGSGPQEAKLRREAEICGVAERVTFQGEVDQAGLIDMYNAADAVVLASSSEGMPNVLLEALACGTPVIASDVSDNRFIIDHPDSGEVLQHRSPEAIAAAIRSVITRNVDRDAVRARAARFDWGVTCDGIMETFRAAMTRSDAHRSATVGQTQ